MAISFGKIRNNLGLRDILPFGRYQGYSVLEIVKDRPSYISWLIQNTELKFDKPVHDELARHLKKHVPRGAGVKRIYFGGLRGDLAHESMSQIDSVWNDDPVYLEGFEDVPF